MIFEDICSIIVFSCMLICAGLFIYSIHTKNDNENEY